MNQFLTPDSQTKLKKLFQLGSEQGCPKDQLFNFFNAGIILQPRQLAASAAARLCDQPDGPTAIGYGGARGGGKTHWLFAQMAADDCQRVPGLNCLLLRKVGKSNLEHFEAVRQRLFRSLPHEFNASRGVLTFPNGSRITLGHFQCEKDIDSYLGREFDVIGIEEATQLTLRKYQDIATCCRTSKPNWRPRIYSTTNPGGIGHQWYFEKFIVPFQSGTESATRFIPARVDDNAFINPEYKAELASRTGWQYAAWCQGLWNISAGQYFRNFHPAVHILGHESSNLPSLSPDPAELGQLDPDRVRFLDELARRRRFRESDAVKWFAAMDYGYNHPTVVLLGCCDHEDNLHIVDEHVERFWIPSRNAKAIKAMFARHRIYLSRDHLRESVLAQYPDYCREQDALWHQGLQRMLSRFVAGKDVFNTESNGDSIAYQYRRLGLSLHPASTDRASGWSAILQRLGDPPAGILPSLFIHKRCQRLIECLPLLQHDPDRPGDVLKSDINEEGTGGDDPADALRYLVAYRPPELHIRKLTGW